jgi:trehalose synthase
VGGIPLQIVDGETGYLVNTLDECAERVTFLLQQPEIAERMGMAGREFVREHFLITRYLRDYLRIFNMLRDGAEVGEATGGRAADAGGAA